MPDIHLLHDALARFGIQAEAVVRLRGGAANEHWRVESGGRVCALRRYRSRHTVDDIEYEHHVLTHMAARGWPVAVPLPAKDGRTVVEENGRHFTLFPFLPGKPVRGGGLDALHEKGRLLAGLHAELAGCAETSQRPGFGHVTDLDAWVAPDGFAGVEPLLEQAARDEPALVETVREERAANQQELRQLGFDQQPDMLVHFEFYSGNLLFEESRLSAVLDFDFLHRDHALSDIGRSIVIDCMTPDGIDPAGLTAFLTGYLSHTRLDNGSLELTVPLLRANLLWQTVLPLSLWAAGDPAPYLLPSARHTALVHLPALSRQRAGLEAAVRAAASG